MKVENFRVISRKDELGLDGLLMMPDEPKAVLQISHGMCEYKERYIPFMEYMVAWGYACVISDHRGHGKSIKAPEDLGYFYEHGGEFLVEDLHQIMEYAKERFPGLPYILMGHSMGSLAARCFTKKYDDELDGLIVCGCPGENTMASVGLALQKFAKIYRGGRGRSSILEDLFFSNFQKPFEAEQLQNSWICSDKAVVEKYNEDPLCNFTFTLNGYESLIWLSQTTYSEQGWGLKNAELPIHFISGEDDSCMINDIKFEEAVELMKKVGYRQVTSQLYQGMRHEILNEIGKEQVFADVAAFCDKILSTNN